MVELIVVMAIIAILSAILVPMILGYVTRSRIASANSSAGKIRDSVTYFMTKAGAEDYGMFLTRNAICDVDVDIQNGTWHMLLSDPSVFLQKYNAMWVDGEGSGTVNDGQSNSVNAVNRFASHLANTFPSINSGYVRFRLIGGMCYALYFTEQQITAVDDFPDFGDASGWSINEYEWNGQEQGINPDGIVIGTSPVLPLKVAGS